MSMKHLKKILGNTFLYMIIALALYFLYSPMNAHPDNETHSAIQFVYQQF